MVSEKSSVVDNRTLSMPSTEISNPQGVSPINIAALNSKHWLAIQFMGDVVVLRDIEVCDSVKSPAIDHLNNFNRVVILKH